MNETNEHNPDGLTPEQYGAPEWRLLTRGETPDVGDEVDMSARGIRWEKVETRFDGPINIRFVCAYRRRVSPTLAEQAQRRAGADASCAGYCAGISLHEWNTRPAESALNAAREALSELADIVDAVNACGYRLDSFTTQPAREALAQIDEALSPSTIQNNMKPTTRIAIAELLAAAGNVLSRLADEFGRELPPQETQPEATPDPEKPKRGRKPAAAAPVTTEPAQPEAPAEPAAPTKTYEDMKAVIKPFVDAGRGLEVKATIAKFAPSLREMDPKHYAAFEAAMAALPAEKPEEY